MISREAFNAEFELQVISQEESLMKKSQSSTLQLELIYPQNFNLNHTFGVHLMTYQKLFRCMII
jgi:hypothetical protein